MATHFLLFSPFENLNDQGREKYMLDLEAIDDFYVDKSYLRVRPPQSSARLFRPNKPLNLTIDIVSIL